MFPYLLTQKKVLFLGFFTTLLLFLFLASALVFALMSYNVSLTASIIVALVFGISGFFTGVIHIIFALNTEAFNLFAFKLKKIKKTNRDVYEFFTDVYKEQELALTDFIKNPKSPEKWEFLLILQSVRDDVEAEETHSVIKKEHTQRREFIKRFAKQFKELSIKAFKFREFKSFLGEEYIYLYINIKKETEKNGLYEVLPVILDIENSANVKPRFLGQEENYKVLKFSKISGLNNLKSWDNKPVLKDFLGSGVQIEDKGDYIQIKQVKSIKNIDTKNTSLFTKIQKNKIYFGEDVSGSKYLEIGDMHNFLISGSSGSGKTVFVKSFLLQMLYNAKHVPNFLEKLKIIDMKGGADFSEFIKFDPEKLEDTPKFRGVEVITQGRVLLDFLLDLYLELRARQIYAKTKKISKITENMIFVYIDEFADAQNPAGLSSRERSSINNLFTLILQQCRASNIFLMSALQRASGADMDANKKDNMLHRIVGLTPSKQTQAVIVDPDNLEFFGAEPEKFSVGEFFYQDGLKKQHSHFRSLYISDADFSGFLESEGVEVCNSLNLEHIKIKYAKKELAENDALDPVFLEFFEGFLKKSKPEEPEESGKIEENRQQDKQEKRSLKDALDSL